MFNEFQNERAIEDQNTGTGTPGGLMPSLQDMREFQQYICDQKDQLPELGAATKKVDYDMEYDSINHAARPAAMFMEQPSPAARKLMYLVLTKIDTDKKAIVEDLGLPVDKTLRDIFSGLSPDRAKCLVDSINGALAMKNGTLAVVPIKDGTTEVWLATRESDQSKYRASHLIHTFISAEEAPRESWIKSLPVEVARHGAIEPNTEAERKYINRLVERLGDFDNIVAIKRLEALGTRAFGPLAMGLTSDNPHVQWQAHKLMEKLVPEVGWPLHLLMNKCDVQGLQATRQDFEKMIKFYDGLFTKEYTQHLLEQIEGMEVPKQGFLADLVRRLRNGEGETAALRIEYARRISRPWAANTPVYNQAAIDLYAEALQRMPSLGRDTAFIKKAVLAGACDCEKFMTLFGRQHGDRKELGKWRQEYSQDRLRGYDRHIGGPKDEYDFRDDFDL